jgi:ubiquitin-protein ligase
MNRLRWQFEQRKMRQAFPEFQPFVNPQRREIGFVGSIKQVGGQIHHVRIVANLDAYPATPPKIYLDPFVGSHRLSDGTLCLHRQWRPAQDSMAGQIPFTLKYILQH